MKLKPFHIIIILGFFFFETQTLMAQESPVYPDNMENDRAQQYTPGTGDLKSLSNTRGSTLSDSSYVNSQNEAIKTAEKNEAKQTEEDVLSFNFLYYIIQKFKMSDIVEK